MTLKTKLLGAGAALLLSTGAALAVPATAQTDLNVRSGPGTQYPVVGSIQGGETVDVGSCTGQLVPGELQRRFGLREPQLSGDGRRSARPGGGRGAVRL